MKWVITLFLALAGAIILIAFAGWLLPKNHAATRQMTYHQPPDAVWSAITDVGAMPSWREGLKSIKPLPGHNGLPAHIEVTSFGEIPIETAEMIPPQKLVTRVADLSLPYGGTWTFEITPAPGGATLRITENGWVSNPIFRFLSRFVFGYSSNIESYLRSLAKKFGEPAQIEP
jgi:uncharacterized protein YndB with AHSA1/START domain